MNPVTALIVTYAPNADILNACVQSLLAQTPSPKILIADNFSPADPDHIIAKAFSKSGITVLTFHRNYGFGGAINRALKHIDTPYVIISNFDIVYEPGWISSALKRLESEGKDTVGISGKTLFYPPGSNNNWPGRGPKDPPLTIGHGTGGVIDNTGTLVNGLMLAYNRGVGQIDIGQYDTPDRPMGACFAAFLVRREAFRQISKGGVGLLDAGFFMYYEDIDWCYRANILGFRIAYEPLAVAWHHHSLTTRDKPLFFKYFLIQRNLYRTIIKNMRLRTYIKLALLHARLHIRRARVEREFAPVTWRILLDMISWKPLGLVKRIPIQLHRKISDTDIINLSIGEEGHLDDIALRPKADWNNILASLQRLKRVYPDNPALEMLPTVQTLASGATDIALAEKVADIAASKCPALSRLISQITSEGGRSSR